MDRLSRLVGYPQIRKGNLCKVFSGTTDPLPRENSSCPMAFELEHHLFLPLDWNRKHWLFLSLKTLGFGAGTTLLRFLVLRTLDSDWN